VASGSGGSAETMVSAWLSECVRRGSLRRCSCRETGAAGGGGSEGGGAGAGAGAAASTGVLTGAAGVVSPLPPHNLNSGAVSVESSPPAVAGAGSSGGAGAGAGTVTATTGRCSK